MRFRINSSLGLSAYDIAGIAVFGSLAFGFGATLIGFGALAYHPHAFNSLTVLNATTIRWGSIAIVGLCIAGLAFLASRNSEITIRGHSLRTPSLGIMLGQLVFTGIDILLAGTTLYLLLPPSDLGFATFLAVCAAAIFAGPTF